MFRRKKYWYYVAMDENVDNVICCVVESPTRHFPVCAILDALEEETGEKYKITFFAQISKEDAEQGLRMKGAYHFKGTKFNQKGAKHNG